MSPSSIAHAMRRLAKFSVCLLIAALAGGPPAPAAAQTAELLPDLRQDVPLDWSLRAVPVDGRIHYRLGFRSAVENVGQGPLVVVASRPSIGEPLMTAEQKILHADGSIGWVPDIGRLRFDVNPTHQHWHFLAFDRYELRSARRYRRVRRGRKAGFCLGDRYPIAPPPAATPAVPAYSESNCGSGDAGLLTLEEGISVGWGDNYDPQKEGQYLDLTGVKAGRYYVLHRVNVDGRIREVSRRNNAASALISIRWPHGKRRPPRVRILAECPRGNRCRGPRLYTTVPVHSSPSG
jgi:hypothetical protein